MGGLLEGSDKGIFLKKLILEEERERASEQNINQLFSILTLTQN